MILAWLLLLTGLTISAVAIYYSVIGLAAIFAAATVPIYIMGSSLEVAKLVCASWLKANWEKAPGFMKGYMMTAVMVLMLITSMGIFGFLSKAHTDQGITSGDAVAKLAIYDEKIKTEKDNIDANRKVLKQLDEAVDQVMARSQDEKGADKAVAIRKAQQKDRSRISQEIVQSQKTIAALNEERAPIAAENRKIEAEVGPIKYIAKLIYGDNPDANLLEKAVTWVIILIVIVFDPLAVIMLLAAQMTFGWLREEKNKAKEEHQPIYVADVTMPEPGPGYEADDGPLSEEQIAQIKETAPKPTEEKIACYKCGTELIDAPGIGLFCPNKACDVADATSGNTVTFIDNTKPESDIEAWNKMIAAAEEEARKEKEAADEAAIWAEENKETEGAAEAKQWAEEQAKPAPDLPVVDESKKKDKLHDQGTGQNNSQREEISYVQNAEQATSSVWSKINERLDVKPIDELYVEYSTSKFDNIVIDKNNDPEFYLFVQDVKENGPRFNSYPKDQLTTFANKIYELRKNQRNNTAG